MTGPSLKSGARMTGLDRGSEAVGDTLEQVEEHKEKIVGRVEQRETRRCCGPASVLLSGFTSFYPAYGLKISLSRNDSR